MTADASRPRVLVIEDERAIQRFLRVGLDAEGYAVDEAVTGREGLTLAAMHVPDVVLLDLGLPDRDGLSVLSGFREWSSVPVIVLTARGQEHDKVRALDAGADDYVTKPFSMPELLARIRVALRHRTLGADGAEDAVLDCGRVRVDLARRRVTVDERVLSLTPLEFRLISTLARHAGRVLTHEFLLREVWGNAARGQAHYLRVYMSQLRRKVEADPTRPRILLTELGVGYRMNDS